MAIAQIIKPGEFMRLIQALKKSIYPAVPMLLLPLAIAGGSGQALAATPVANYIGADAYPATNPVSPSWQQADDPTSTYYLGNLTSEKFFYNGAPLPANDATNTFQYNIPGCGATTSPNGPYVYPTNMLCIIVWNTANSIDGSDLQSFLNSTLTDPHQIVMAFCNEPEYHANITEHPEMNTCMCDPTGTPKLCNTASAFTKQFEVESTAITKFEKANFPNGGANVHVVEDSAGNYYRTGTQGCAYIVPSSYASHYLVDIYEGGSGNPIMQPEVLSSDAAWTTWANCTSGASRGLAEFAINCGNEGAYDSAVEQSLIDDDTYLKDNYPNLFVWNIWDSGGCTLNNTDETASTHEWQNITAGN
jgi:hypothetical protein